MRVFSTAFFKPRFCSYLKGQLAASFVVPNYSHDVAFWRLADIPMCSADVRFRGGKADIAAADPMSAFDP
jgi:hypothetical protein